MPCYLTSCRSSRLVRITVAAMNAFSSYCLTYTGHRSRVMLIVRCLSGGRTRFFSQACTSRYQLLQHTVTTTMQLRNRACSDWQLSRAGGHSASQPVLPIPCRGGVASTSNRCIPDTRRMSVVANGTVSRAHAPPHVQTASGTAGTIGHQGVQLRQFW